MNTTLKVRWEYVGDKRVIAPKGWVSIPLALDHGSRGIVFDRLNQLEEQLFYILSQLEDNQE